ncbi:MAG: PEPxxWA-CTERM sorting domain-containing protein [Sphingomonadaceae bacterium]
MNIRWLGRASATILACSTAFGANASGYAEAGGSLGVIASVAQPVSGLTALGGNFDYDETVSGEGAFYFDRDLQYYFDSPSLGSQSIVSDLSFWSFVAAEGAGSSASFWASVTPGNLLQLTAGPQGTGLFSMSIVAWGSPHGFATGAGSATASFEFRLTGTCLGCTGQIDGRFPDFSWSITDSSSATLTGFLLPGASYRVRVEQAWINGGAWVGEPLDPEIVPEPGVWAMLIAGLGLVGSRLRRRRLEFAGAA